LREYKKNKMNRNGYKVEIDRLLKYYIDLANKLTNTDLDHSVVFVMSFRARSTQWIAIAIKAKLVTLILRFVLVDFTCHEKCCDCQQLLELGHHHHILRNNKTQQL
jgi:hypothetical protein